MCLKEQPCLDHTSHVRSGVAISARHLFNQGLEVQDSMSHNDVRASASDSRLWLVSPLCSELSSRHVTTEDPGSETCSSPNVYIFNFFKPESSSDRSRGAFSIYHCKVSCG